MTFTISPLIRDLVDHHPGSLSIEDFYFKCRMCKAVAPLTSGHKLVDMLLKYTMLLTYLEPKEKINFEYDLAPGLLRVTDFLSKATLAFHVAEEGSLETQVVPVKLREGKSDPQSGGDRGERPDLPLHGLKGLHRII